ncbi:hypothetical protein J6590_018591 [Homalodisca vitripennis]|nr:hypothetical protein J6590_018591 [Homalodisca vitripennis]
MRACQIDDLGFARSPEGTGAADSRPEMDGRGRTSGECGCKAVKGHSNEPAIPGVPPGTRKYEPIPAIRRSHWHEIINANQFRLGWNSSDSSAAVDLFILPSGALAVA